MTKPVDLDALIDGWTWQRDNASGDTLESDEVAMIVDLLEELRAYRSLPTECGEGDLCLCDVHEAARRLREGGR